MFQVGDKVSIIDNNKKLVAEGKIYNINEFREPSQMYAVDVKGYEDLLFLGESNLQKI